MKGTKERNSSKGITLIALVITIIVMLLLVAVTVTMSINGGLFEYASKAGKETNKAVNAEQTLANGRIKVEGKWYSSIDEYIAGNELIWEENKDNSFTNVKTGTTVKIGDYVNYECPEVIINTGEYDENGDLIKGYYEGKWRVLGVEDSKILLISTQSFDEINIGEFGGYHSGVATLDNACAPLADGTIAIKARSVTVEDINKITGYSPTAVGGIKGEIYGKGTYGEYGNKVKGWQEFCIHGNLWTDFWCEGENGCGPDNFCGQGVWNDKGEELIPEISYEFKEDKTGFTKEIEWISNYYSYYPNSLSTISTINNENPVGLKITSEAYKMLFEDEEGNQDSYYLASTYCDTGELFDRVNYGFRCISSGYVHGHIVANTISFENGGVGDDPFDSVRAVLVLSENVVLTPVSGVDNEYNLTLPQN